jgi:hypothetical protein
VIFSQGEMIGTGIQSLVFEEPLGVAVPTCLDVVASACWVGFRLLRPPTPNLENVVMGCRRLPQFKDAKRGNLRREIRWHFHHREVEAFGARMNVLAWRIRWESDAALRRTVMDHPAFAKWHAGLLESFRAQPLVALAQEGPRQCYGAFRGDAETLRAMHGFMEEGGI